MAEAEIAKQISGSLNDVVSGAYQTAVTDEVTRVSQQYTSDVGGWDDFVSTSNTALIGDRQNVVSSGGRFTGNGADSVYSRLIESETSSISSFNASASGARASIVKDDTSNIMAANRWSSDTMSAIKIGGAVGGFVGAALAGGIMMLKGRQSVSNPVSATAPTVNVDQNTGYSGGNRSSVLDTQTTNLVNNEESQFNSDAERITATSNVNDGGHVEEDLATNQTNYGTTESFDSSGEVSTIANEPAATPDV